MKRQIFSLAILLAAVLLGGCASTMSPTQMVASQRIGAHPVGGIRRQQSIGNIPSRGFKLREPRRKNCPKHKHAKDAERQQHNRIAEETAHRHCPQAAPLGDGIGSGG